MPYPKEFCEGATIPPRLLLAPGLSQIPYEELTPAVFDAHALGVPTAHGQTPVWTSVWLQPEMACLLDDLV
jgi:hypothetical protein